MTFQRLRAEPGETREQVAACPGDLGGGEGDRLLCWPSPGQPRGEESSTCSIANAAWGAGLETQVGADATGDSAVDEGGACGWRWGVMCGVTGADPGPIPPLSSWERGLELGLSSSAPPSPVTLST